MDGLAAEVHAHAGPNGGDVIGPQQGDHLFQGVQHLLAGHVHLGMVRADVIRHFSGVFQINGILVHANGESADLLPQHQRADGAHQRGIQSAGEQEAQWSVGVQPLIHTGDQLVADGAADGLQIVMTILRNSGQVGVADELAVCVIMPRREGADLLAEADEVFGLAGEHDAAVIQIAVEQRPDADGVPGGDEGIRLVVIDDHGELRVQLGKHRKAVFPVQRQNDLAVAAALEFVALLRQLPLQGTEAVQLPVAHHHIAVQLKGLHAGLGQAHDGQPVETQPARAGVHDLGHVGATGNGPVKIGRDLTLVQLLGGKTHNCAHKKAPPEKIKAANDPKILGRIAAASVVPPNLPVTKPAPLRGSNKPLCFNAARRVSPTKPSPFRSLLLSVIPAAPLYRASTAPGSL